MLAVQRKVGSQVLENLLHRGKSPFISIEARSPAPGHISAGTVKLQAHVLGSVLAVQRKVGSQVLENLLHRGKSPFISIEARSPAPGHLKVKRSHYLRPMHAAKSTRYSAMVLHSAVNSFFMQLHLLFPGPQALKYGVFYISLSIDIRAGANRSVPVTAPRRWGVS